MQKIKVVPPDIDNKEKVLELRNIIHTMIHKAKIDWDTVDELDMEKILSDSKYCHHVSFDVFLQNAKQKNLASCNTKEWRTWFHEAFLIVTVAFLNILRLSTSTKLLSDDSNSQTLQRSKDSSRSASSTSTTQNFHCNEAMRLLRENVQQLNRNGQVPAPVMRYLALLEHRLVSSAKGISNNSEQTGRSIPVALSDGLSQSLRKSSSQPSSHTSSQDFYPTLAITSKLSSVRVTKAQAERMRTNRERALRLRAERNRKVLFSTFLIITQLLLHST